MKTRLRALLSRLGDSFWLLPAVIVALCVVAAFACLAIDRAELLPAWLMESNWLYNGGGTGARTLLGAIAASTIGVVGTVFSITIAALTLAAGQMGPRLLHNFTRDRGNQFTLGAFLGTFCYALMVLRSVRTQDEGAFTPHLALTVGMLLAFGCVGTLVYFMGHMAGRINVDTVIDLVGDDVRNGLDQLVADGVQADPPAAAFWNDAAVVTDDRRGYLQHLDEDGLADWAAAHGTVVRLLVRRGDFVFPGAPIALTTVDVAGAREAIRAATSLGSARTSSGDPEQAIRQLVEVGVRALSPGINDPHTAMSVLDRLGAALCDLAGCKLASGVVLRDGAVALVVPTVTYRTLTGVMFHMLRQNSRGSTAMYLKLLRVLGVVVACESDPARRAMLQKHADQVLDDAGRTIANLQDLAAIRSSHSGLKRWLAGTALEALLDSPSTADD